MSKRYPGGLLSTTGVREPSASDQSKNSGVWTLEEQHQSEASGTWANQSGQAYQISRSLRFRQDNSTYLTRTPTTTGDRRTWTYSVWVKRNQLSSDGFLLYATDPGNDGNNHSFLQWFGDKLRFAGNVGGVTQVDWRTTAEYRDPAAWYHIVLNWNTTAVALDDRVRLYVNGVQVTSWSTKSPSPSQNAVLNINLSGYPHRIGWYSGTSFYLDGYLAEANFIDGQALDPSYFGYYDYNGIWQPKKYRGEYGLNGFYLPFKDNQNLSYLGADRKPDTYLEVTTGSGGALTTSDFRWGRSSYNMGNWLYQEGGGGFGLNWDMHNIFNKNFTFEFWYKGTAAQTNFGSQDGGVLSGYNYLVGKGRVNSAFYGWGLHLYSDGNLGLDEFFGGGSSGVFTSGVNILDNVWHHIAVTRNGSTTRIYVDGVQRASGTLNNNTNNGYGLSINGMWDYSNGNYITYRCGGLMDDFRFYTGITKYTSNFTVPSGPLPIGEDDFFWGYVSAAIPFEGANGQTRFPLWIQQQFAPNNFNIADSSADSPTNGSPLDDTGLGGQINGSYATLNPHIVGQTNTIRMAGTQAFLSAGANAYHNSYGTIPMTSGKWYWECYVQRDQGAGQWVQVGIVNSTVAPTNAAAGYSGNMSSAYAYFNDGSRAGNGTVTASYGATFNNGDSIGVAFDADNGTLTFFKNGVSQGVAYSGIPNTIEWVPLGQIFRSNGTFQLIDFNFGHIPFNYPAPAGFKTLNTTNLPISTIPNGRKYFDSIRWLGSGDAIRDIAGLQFRPDLLWSKTRNATNWPFVSDSVRGLPNKLYTNDMGTEDTNPIYGLIRSFNADGFTTGPGTDSMPGAVSDVNAVGTSYVAWNWKAGDNLVTNTSGTITTQVRANNDAGFSIIGYTGNGAEGATIGHGLNRTPKFIIIRHRSGAGNRSWPVWSHITTQSAGSVFTSSTVNIGSKTGGVLSLNLTVAAGAYGLDPQTNGIGSTYIAYCWAEIPGFSKIGTYTGNGSTNGPFIHLGFRPAWIMIKNTSASEQWAIVDNTRYQFNDNIAHILFANSNSTEDLNTDFHEMDFVSNGVKIRGANQALVNGSGNNYVYLAFAENPFYIARAR